MKTGYVYIVAVKGRRGRVLRLGTSFRNPSERLARYSQAGGRRRRAKLIAFDFVEDLIGARAQIRAELRRMRVKGHSRTFACSVSRARRALAHAAARQATIRKVRFHPHTGLLIDQEIELAGPIAAFARTVADLLTPEIGGDLKRLNVYLHPYMVGMISTLFRETQATTKIPDEYLPEIIRDVAWRTWKCQLKPGVFLRMSQKTRREQSFVDLARYAFEHTRQVRPEAPGQRNFSRPSQMLAFVRAPEAHLGETMRSYVDALARAPAVKLRNIVFRIVQLVCLMAAVFLVDAVMAGTGPVRWLSALLLVFFAGAFALAFNLYEKPDLTRGLGVLSRRDMENELTALRERGLS